MNDSPGTFVILVSIALSYVVLGIVVARQMLEKGRGFGWAAAAFFAWPIVLLVMWRRGAASSDDG